MSSRPAKMLSVWSSLSTRVFQYLAALGANLGMISLGMHYGWSSVSLPILTSGNYTFQITNDEASWLASTVPLSSGAGTILAAIFTNIVGRKKLISYTSLPLTISWLLVAFAPSVAYMFVGRFIAGLTDGFLFTAVPSYLTEISDAEIRGFLASTYSATIVGGMLIMNIFLYFLDMETSAYIAACVSLPMLVILPFLPDSAYFYFLKKNEEKAKASLQKYIGKEDVDKELIRISEGVAQELANGGKLTELFTKRKNRKALLLACTICLLTQLIGTNVILVYAATVFEKSKNFLAPDTSNFIYFTVFFVVSTISLALVDISGRKLLLVVSSALTGLTVFGMGTFLYFQDHTDVDVADYEYIQLVLLLLNVLFYGIGLQTIPVLVASELFPSNVKGFGLCITNITYSLSVTAALKFFSWSTDTIGMFVSFYFFGVMAVAMIVFALTVLPETKGKTLEQVQLKLKKKKSCMVC